MSGTTSDLLFDEFGNPLNGVSEDFSSDDESDISMHDIDSKKKDEVSDAVVVADERPVFSTLSETFGDDVETIIATSDAKRLDEPIVEPQVEKNFMLEEEELPPTSYSKEYMWELSKIQEKVRNVALCGNIHSGKTSILDMLIQQTHSFDEAETTKPHYSTKTEAELKYTDNHVLESKKGISLKSSAMSLLLPDLNEMSALINFLDAPGHSNFADEMVISIKLADTVVLCVDIVESATRSTEQAILYCLKTNTKMVLMLTKLDRLVLELRLPPLDAYYKIRRTIEQVNEMVARCCHELKIDYNYAELIMSPELHNVCFSSNVLNTIFSLRSFTKRYIEFNNLEKNPKVTLESLSTKFWGDIYFEDRKFFTKPKNVLASANSRTFIKFILTPIYKMITNSLALDADARQELFEKKMRLRLKKSEYRLDSKPFLKKLFPAFFGQPSLALVSMLKESPSPKSNASSKLDFLYRGPKESLVSQAITDCDSDGPLVAYVTKLVDTRDSEHFYALVRVLSGVIKSGSKVHLLGEEYSPENTDDYKLQKVSKCYMWCGRYKIEIPELRAGSIGLISGPGMDNFIVKSATIYDRNLDEPYFALRGTEQLSPPVFKVALQAYNPKDLTKFIDALKKLNRAYIGCEVKVEDNGEHSIFGYGELYMDCLLHDLRVLYSGIDIKVSDPMVKFSETIDEVSRVKLVIKSNNGKNSVSITAEALDPVLSTDIKNGVISITRDPPRKFAKKLRDVYGWDSFAARSVWSFGPEEDGTCLLCDDTLPEEVDKELLKQHRNAILKGFQWAVKEGPLCEESMHDIKFNIIDIKLSEDEADRNDAQIIQMIRKACHAAVLIAFPKLLEPVYEIESICQFDVLGVLEKLIDRRRGSILGKERVEGTPLWKVKGMLPVIESVGLETDLRLSTQGMAYPQMLFSRWEKVPGDPMNVDAFIPLLKRAPVESIARDFTLKTRRRKGLSDEVTLEKYVDPETWLMLTELEVV